jgi:hypothetical protein
LELKNYLAAIKTQTNEPLSTNEYLQNDLQVVGEQNQGPVAPVPFTVVKVGIAPYVLQNTICPFHLLEKVLLQLSLDTRITGKINAYFLVRQA